MRRRRRSDCLALKVKARRDKGSIELMLGARHNGLRLTSTSCLRALSPFLRRCPQTMSKFDPDYFPARLNGTLNAGKYKILRKLGEGVSSSSWLVHNHKGE